MPHFSLSWQPVSWSHVFLPFVSFFGHQNDVWGRHLSAGSESLRWNFLTVFICISRLNFLSIFMNRSYCYFMNYHLLCFVRASIRKDSLSYRTQYFTFIAFILTYNSKILCSFWDRVSHTPGWCELMTLRSLPPQCWGYLCASLCLAKTCFKCFSSLLFTFNSYEFYALEFSLLKVELWKGFCKVKDTIKRNGKRSSPSPYLTEGWFPKHVKNSRN